MKVCIYGAGAIGGYLASGLAKGGAEVSLIARGPHLAAIRRQGLTVRQGGREAVTKLAASDRPEDFGPQDYVVIALKAQAIAGILDRLPALLHERTAVVTAVNGVPWWYFHGVGGAYEGKTLETVDPGARQWRVIGPARAIGCVVYPAAEVLAPGVIDVLEGDRFSLGEPDGSVSARVQALADIMRKGGLKAPVRPRLREEIWVKLLGNVSFNPISALTGATLGEICRDASTRALVRAMMVEAAAVAAKLGVVMPIDVDKRIAGAEAVGEHKTSMLQDLERGRPMEIDALVASVAELGRLTSMPTPHIDAVLALVRQRAALAGCYTIPSA